MDYSNISDPELRKSLIEARQTNNSKKVATIEGNISNVNDSSINNKNEDKLSNKIVGSIGQKTTSNRKFDSLKSTRKRKRKRRLKPPSTKSLAVATKQLSSMIRTGLPLLESLNILAEGTDDKTLRIVFKEASIGISRGGTFVSILERYPEVFDDMYIALVSAGEAAGLLPSVLEREAMLLESISKIKGQVKSALTYPIAIFILTVIVIFIMLIFVIPIFVDMYAASGTDLPAITQFLVDCSNNISDPSFIIKLVPSTFLGVYIFNKQSKYNYFINWRDSIILRLPISKDIVTKSCLASFSRTLSALNSAGVPILESLAISKRTIGNRVFQSIVDRMNVEIQSGQPLYKVLAGERIIPIMFTSMFRVGEETGELSEMINKLADFYEDEVSTSVKSLTSILEPLMIVFVATIVAFILVAMYLPMFNMMSTVN